MPHNQLPNIIVPLIKGGDVLWTDGDLKYRPGKLTVPLNIVVGPP